VLGVLISIFFILLILGVPIAFSIGAATFIPLMLDGRLPFTLVITRLFGGMDSFPLMAIPFFVLTGTLASACNLVDRIMQLANFLVGRMRAGLAQVDIVTSMLFGGVSGSAVADCAATASILIPSMTNKGYPKSYAVGVCATSSTIGALIPPSIPMIIYGFLTNVSTGKLFLAGALPGVLVGILLMITAYILSIRGGFGRDDDAPRRTLPGFYLAVRESAPALTIPFIIIGGIVGGVFTPTEAGIIAAVAVLLVGQFCYGGFTLRKLRDAVMSAALTTSMVMLILAASTVFANLLTRAQFQSQAIVLLNLITDVPELQLLLVVIMLLILGCFIDGTAILIMFAAPLFGVGQALGYDPLQFGTIIVMCCLIGGVTPPVGTLMFISAAVARIGLGEASRGIFPFFLALCAALLLVAAFPPLTTFLPRLLLG
jgi:C4-dicarboxylate transporter DctM subunit